MTPTRFLDRHTPPHIATLILMAGLSALTMNIFLPSLPGMAAWFDAPYSLMQLSVALYLALSAVLQIVIGPISDRFGRRKVLLVSLSLFLIATFYGTVVLYLMMKAEFVAMTQLVVYIGGIVSVVVFTILLTSSLGEKHLTASRRRRLLALLLAGGFCGLLGKQILDLRGLLAGRLESPAEFASLDELGRRLLTPGADGFLLPFELISLLLLTAIIGALVMAARSPPGPGTPEGAP